MALQFANQGTRLLAWHLPAASAARYYPAAVPGHFFRLRACGRQLVNVVRRLVRRGSSWRVLSRGVNKSIGQPSPNSLKRHQGTRAPGHLHHTHPPPSLLRLSATRFLLFHLRTFHPSSICPFISPTFLALPLRNSVRTLIAASLLSRPPLVTAGLHPKGPPAVSLHR